MIERIGVVVPVHNEEALLPACLDAVRIAVSAVDLPTKVVVVLDGCTDGSARVTAEHAGFEPVEIKARNVGLARAAGSNTVLRWAAGLRPDRVWLATTDADSVVPRDWLRRQIELASTGWEAVVGTIRVEDWSEHPAHVKPAWLASYRAIEHHPHVHGANFGCTAAAYLHAGGWMPVASDEDVALVAALRGRRVLRTATIPVLTSARRNPRARGGFGDALLELAGAEGVA
ncbi:MAG TPA: glycosyltransferase family 2 protein [Mycobacteriales bacterium]|jgi:glycosyltransferase involved in cell wall biosynthesis|nr:glycosyltransferase family 2 protein [Mycobacteriales bacterium]